MFSVSLARLRVFSFIVILLLHLATPSIANALNWPTPTQLTAGATLRFEFPDLPNTLAGLASQSKRIPVLSAELPKNYTSEKRFPLLVYLKGYDGGRDDTPDMARWMAGPDDFIAVSLPLFKKQLAADNRVTPITAEDFEMTRNAYRVMLEKLLEAIPNIDSKRSCIGGHSNGAHALGVLLSGGDEFLLEHFDSFFLHEGGMALFMPDAKPSDLLQRSRLLVLLGETSMGRTVPFREGAPIFRDRISESTARYNWNCEVVTMLGYGHDVPPEYHRLIGQWIRGEKHVDVPAKERELNAELNWPLKTHPATSNWNELLTLDLTNMRVSGNSWKYDGQVLAAHKDEIMWTKADHADCIIDFEFRLDPGASGGLFLYNSSTDQGVPRAVEIQICDDHANKWRESPVTSRCSAFVGHQAPIASAVKAAGQWNRMTVTCQGSSVTVWLNDTLVNDIDLTQWKSGSHNPDGSEIPMSLQGKPWAEQPHRGRIGLQGRDDDGEVAFRSLKILRLRK